MDDWWGYVTVKSFLSYHFNRAECNNGVTTPAVGPGIPARILPLLKHILLPLTAGLLVSHPSERAEEKQMDVCEGKVGKKSSGTHLTFSGHFPPLHLILIHRVSPLFL